MYKYVQRNKIPLIYGLRLIEKTATCVKYNK